MVPEGQPPVLSHVPPWSSTKLAHGRRLARNLVREGKRGKGRKEGGREGERERGREGRREGEGQKGEREDWNHSESGGKRTHREKGRGVVELSSAPYSLLGLPACILQLISLRVMASGIRAICLGPRLRQKVPAFTRT